MGHKGHQETLYFSGDSAYDTHFPKIAERCGPIDLACLEVAADVKQHQGYPVENWGHMQAKHTVQPFGTYKPKTAADSLGDLRVVYPPMG